MPPASAVVIWFLPDVEEAAPVLNKDARCGQRRMERGYDGGGVEGGGEMDGGDG